MDASTFGARASGHLVITEGGHPAFVPAPLPPELTFTAELAERLSAADAALGELSGLAGGRRDPQILVAPFLRQEAVLSSRIEGTPATLVDLLFDEVAAAPDLELRESLREVRNYVAALQYGVERLAEVPLGTRLVLELHERLLRGVRDAAWTPGELRSGQNWIGPPGSTIETAVYVPPPVPEMHAALSEWDRFLAERTGLPPLVQCALLHERFEAIHPFLEGNGRLGRLLITLFLIERGRLSHPLLYPSAYIEAHRDEYYGLLQAVRTDGAWEPWLRFFLDAIRETAERASAQARALMALARAVPLEGLRPRAAPGRRPLPHAVRHRARGAAGARREQRDGAQGGPRAAGVGDARGAGGAPLAARLHRAAHPRRHPGAARGPAPHVRGQAQGRAAQDGHRPRGAAGEAGRAAHGRGHGAHRRGAALRRAGAPHGRPRRAPLLHRPRLHGPRVLGHRPRRALGPEPGAARGLHAARLRREPCGDGGDGRRPAPVRQDRGAGGRRRRLPHRRRARGRPPGAPRRPRRPLHGRHAHGPRPRRPRSGCSSTTTPSRRPTRSSARCRSVASTRRTRTT